MTETRTAYRIGNDKKNHQFEQLSPHPLVKPYERALKLYLVMITTGCDITTAAIIVDKMEQSNNE